MIAAAFDVTINRIVNRSRNGVAGEVPATFFVLG
jgi:hypothetical protein